MATAKHTDASAPVTLRNDLWDLEIQPALNGRVSRLVEHGSGAVRVQPPPDVAGLLAEGGHAPFFGLDCWLKCGNGPDPNTGVLSTFAPLREAPMTAVTGRDHVTLTAQRDGLVLTITWTLPAGSSPLHCRMQLRNDSAPPEAYQFEGFFMWHLPPETRARTATLFPDHAPVSLKPYGETWFSGGQRADGNAAWWHRGTAEGVVMRPGPGIRCFFYGIQPGSFILGPHSQAATLAPGDSLEAEFEVAPLTWARAHGWEVAIAAAEDTLAAEDDAATTLATHVGTVATWACGPAHADPLPHRQLHLTLQYAPIAMHAVMELLEKVAAPCGYNELVIEVDRAFPYRSHPQVAAPWSWTGAQWHEFVGAARALGFTVIPQYNALGHQPESGLATAYPELREDANGWCLCPRQPDTMKFLCQMVDELLAVFEPRQFHVGLDEVAFAHRAPTFGICPRCRNVPGGELFAEHVLGLHAHLKARGQEMLMWADMLAHKPEHNTLNGLRSGTWQALDRLPRDIIMIDWVYGPVADYGLAKLLLASGFRVMGATWFDARVVPVFAEFADQHGLYGMCATTWSPPALLEIPLVAVLAGGKCFRAPRQPAPGRVLAEARALALNLARGR